MAAEPAGVYIRVDDVQVYIADDYMSSSTTTIYSIITNDAGLNLNDYSSEIIATDKCGYGRTLQVTETTTVNNLYTNFSCPGILINLTTKAQVSKKVQKLMNNGEEYIISGGDLPSGGTTGQVLTKTETGAEWKDFQGGIASDTITGIWGGSAEDYASVEKEEGVIYFVKE